MLNDHGLRATFYLNPSGNDWEQCLAPWQKVAEAGHELGNHTVTHICSRVLYDNLERKSLEECSLQEIEEDIALGYQRIRQLVPHQADITFAYPCWHTHVGEGEQRQSYVPIVAKYHVAARSEGYRANHPLTAPLHGLSGWSGERGWGPTLVGLAERCATEGRWGIITFHGINEGHLAVNDEDFEELCRHLQAHSDRIWVAPVAEVARAVLDWRQS